MKYHIRDATKMGDLYNNYGTLAIKEKDGKYYWGMEGPGNTIDGVEIPEYLYNALKKYEEAK